MRRASVTLLLVALLAGWPAHAGARDAGRDFGLAGAAVGANLLYTPPKLLTALIGLVGCVTSESENLSERPWNTPKGWETGLPSSMNEGR